MTVMDREVLHTTLTKTNYCQGEVEEELRSIEDGDLEPLFALILVHLPKLTSVRQRSRSQNYNNYRWSCVNSLREIAMCTAPSISNFFAILPSVLSISADQLANDDNGVVDIDLIVAGKKSNITSLTLTRCRW